MDPLVKSNVPLEDVDRARPINRQLVTISSKCSYQQLIPFGSNTYLPGCPLSNISCTKSCLSTIYFMIQDE